MVGSAGKSTSHCSQPAKRIELRYTLSGITMRSIPSRAGRALTAISPLVEGVPRDLPVASHGQRKHGAQHRVPSSDAAQQAGVFGRTSAASSCRRTAAVEQALIVVQFDLPKPQ